MNSIARRSSLVASYRSPGAQVHCGDPETVYQRRGRGETLFGRRCHATSARQQGLNGKRRPAQPVPDNSARAFGPHLASLREI
jgi:hypothetical protein